MDNNLKLYVDQGQFHMIVVFAESLEDATDIARDSHLGIEPYEWEEFPIKSGFVSSLEVIS